MSLLDFASKLSAFGMTVRAAPSTDHPELPEGEGPVTLALRIPAAQLAALLEWDGADFSTEETPVAAKRLRRVLRELRDDDDVIAWAVVPPSTPGGPREYLHLLVTRAQARQWYRWLDWTLATRKFEAARSEHVFS